MNREIVTLGIRLFHVGWMVIGLGIALELLVLGVIVAGGGDPTVGGFAVAVFTRVSWSMVVCAALAVTTALPRAAIPASGIAGLLVAPAATVTVKVIQRMTSQALAGHAASIWLPAVAALSVIKGVEYLWLGAALAWLGGRGYGIVAAWAVGGITGVVGAAAVAGVNLVAGTPTLAVVSGAVNELLFPIGCATILVASTWLARLTAAAAGAPTPAVAEDAR